jgi:hypothetical protein
MDLPDSHALKMSNVALLGVVEGPNEPRRLAPILDFIAIKFFRKHDPSVPGEQRINYSLCFEWYMPPCRQGHASATGGSAGRFVVRHAART